MTNHQYWSVFYVNSIALIPTCVETTAGVGRLVDPMEVIDAKKTSELKYSILKTIAKRNPIILHPSREEMSKISIHKKVGFKSYKSFNQSAKLWKIHFFDDAYEIFFTKVPEDGRGYDRDMSKTITFPQGTPVETVVDKLIEIIQETHKQKMAENAEVNL